jgi:hypothetical protein
MQRLKRHEPYIPKGELHRPAYIRFDLNQFDQWHINKYIYEEFERMVYMINNLKQQLLDLSEEHYKALRYLHNKIQGIPDELPTLFEPGLIEFCGDYEE